jgi:YHS domain-containing protein
MMVDPHAAKPTYEYKGETHYFCSEGCRIKFAREPERFLDKKGESEPLPKGRTLIYRRQTQGAGYADDRELQDSRLL